MCLVPSYTFDFNLRVTAKEFDFVEFSKKEAALQLNATYGVMAMYGDKLPKLATFLGTDHRKRIPIHGPARIYRRS